MLPIREFHVVHGFFNLQRIEATSTPGTYQAFFFPWLLSPPGTCKRRRRLSRPPFLCPGSIHFLLDVAAGLKVAFGAVSSLYDILFSTHPSKVFQVVTIPLF